MTTNSFEIAGIAKVNIETGFIPSGKEYTRMSEVIRQSSNNEGSFKMNFTNNNASGFNAKVLNVHFIKLKTFKVIYKISTGECDPNYTHLINAVNEAEAIRKWKVVEGVLVGANMTINFIRIN